MALERLENELRAGAVAQYPRPLGNLLPTKGGVASLDKQLSKYGPGTPGILKTLSGESVKSKPFHNNSKILFAFFHFHLLKSLQWSFPETT